MDLSPDRFDALMMRHMYVKTFGDYLSSNEKKPRKYNVSENNLESLRANVWLGSIFQDENIDAKALCLKVFGNTATVRTLQSWLSGEHKPSGVKIDQIDKKYPGSKLIYYSPLFDLLDINLSEKRLNGIFNCYSYRGILKISDGAGLPVFYWNFPDFKFAKTGGALNERYVDRYDIYGFIGALLLLRRAEFDNNDVPHLYYLKLAYRTLPGLLRHKYFKNYAKEIFSLLEDIHCKLPYARKVLRAAFSIIEKNSKAEHPSDHQIPYELAHF